VTCDRSVVFSGYSSVLHDITEILLKVALNTINLNQTTLVMCCLTGFFTLFQIVVEVIDSAWPDNAATGTLTVNIDRNPSGPDFTETTYTRTLRANHLVGDSIIQLQAPDTDGVSLNFFFFRMAVA